MNNTIATGFNHKNTPQRTTVIALDMSKIFDTVNHHTLIHKLQHTNTSPTIIKYIANCMKGRKQFTLYNGAKSKFRNTKTGVPQGNWEIASWKLQKLPTAWPTLFNIYTADLPLPPPHVHTITYADDITILSTLTNPDILQTQVQPCLKQIHTWTKNNQPILNTSKATTT